MRLSCLAIICLLAFATQHSQAEEKAFPLWSDGAPGAIGTSETDIPTLTPYLPDPSIATGAAIIVCPGGGYAHLADHEGKPVAEWLNTIGIAGFVLRYRHAPDYHHPIPLMDAQRAIRTVRARAEEWKLDPHRIGIMGFSAGGHLTASAGTHYDSGDPDAKDPIERVSCRPDVMAPIYGVISMGEYTHQGSKKNLLGENPDPELVELMSNEKQVTPDTPPTFLMHTVEDQAVHSNNSLLFALALREAGVDHELHLYQKGRHGVGLAQDDPILSSWPDRFADWLRVQGFAAEK
ncbi:MAG: alpha/beta hydrolase [Candidatus Omnitrophica bacterium]|nr:alpha/beta hydrolase [Candidatus Omnitrophota bacterium]